MILDFLLPFIFEAPDIPRDLIKPAPAEFTHNNKVKEYEKITCPSSFYEQLSYFQQQALGPIREFKNDEYGIKFKVPEGMNVSVIQSVSGHYVSWIISPQHYQCPTYGYRPTLQIKIYKGISKNNVILRNHRPVGPFINSKGEVFEHSGYFFSVADNCPSEPAPPNEDSVPGPCFDDIRGRRCYTPTPEIFHEYPAVRYSPCINSFFVERSLLLERDDKDYTLLINDHQPETTPANPLFDIVRKSIQFY